MTNQPKSPQISPRYGIFLGILAVSTASIFIRFVQQENLSSLVIAAYRLGIATLLISPLAVIKYREEIKNLSMKDLGFSLLSGLFLAIHFATWIRSLEYTSVASSVVLVTTTPLWVSLLSPFTLKESITKAVGLGLFLALLGTIVIGLSDICDIQVRLECPPFAQFFSGQALWGDFLALIGAWTAAGYVMIGRRVRANLTLVPYIFLVYGMAALILCLLVVGSGVAFYGFSRPTYIWLVALAIIPQLLGHSTFNWALGYLPAALVSVSLLGEPIGSTFLAYLILAEVPGPLKMFGALLIFGGILVASRSGKPLKKILPKK